MLTLSLLALTLAAFPATMVALNLAALREPAPVAPRVALPCDLLVSILIPARNEEANIGDALAAALAQVGARIEVLVGDDASTDRTPEIVGAVACHDPRARIIAVPPLPDGWAGKVHACHRLAEAARGRYLLFVDADVRLARDAAARLAGHASATGAALVSGVPRQVMPTLGELLTVPAINLMLLGYLPIPLLRARPHDPALGAACGQLVLVEAGAYRAAGGHAAIPASFHDGLHLPRLLRRAGFTTDLVAGWGLATCRMYRGFPDAWAGFAKNARDGMARPAALPVWTLLLAGGHLLAPLLVVAALAGTGPVQPVWPAGLALLLSLGARAAITVATRESPWTIPLHPATVAVALAIQWQALLGGRARTATWKGRAAPGGAR